MKKLLLPLLLLVPLGAKADGLDDTVKELMDQEKIPGVSLAIIHKGVAKEKRSYGLAHVAENLPVTSKTTFRIASMSKQFCALSILLLEREGKLRRSDQVNTILPDAPAEWKGITIEHLLAHQAGLEEPKGFSYSKEFSIPEWLRLFQGTKPAFGPGEKYEYSNFGYATLGLIVEKVSGLPLRDFVRLRFFEPLGMRSTFYWDPALQPADHALGYRFSEGKQVAQQVSRPKAFDGSGGIVSNIEDLIRWEAALRGNFFPPEVRANAWTPHSLRDGKPTSYGCGFFIRTTNGQTKIWHSGTTFGFTSRFTRYVTEDLTVIVLRNGAGPEGGSQKMEEAIADWARKNLVSRER